MGLFALIWGLALAGILFKLRFTGRFNFLSTAAYTAMGWLGVVAARPMVAHVPANALIWLLAGGFTYNVGVIFYAYKRMPYSHPIWHVFVLSGSICHYFAVLSTVIPPRT